MLEINHNAQKLCMNNYIDASNISVLIISFNCWDLLDACLKSIYSSDSSFKEIIVIDNASVDGTCEKLNIFYPAVRLIENDENVGHTKAVNQGCRLCLGEFVLLLDADTEIRRDCVKIMASFLATHPEVSMVAPKTYLTNGSLQDSAKNFPSPINGIFGRQSLLTRMFPNNPFSRRYLALSDYDILEPLQVEHVSAACMLFRRDIFSKVGSWDEGYHSYWVDADWCKMIQLAGGGIYYIPKAVIIHHEQNHRTFKKSPVRIVKFHSGAFRFYCKHYTWGIWDPRSAIAATFLMLRALLLLTTNIFKKSPHSRIDPLTIQKGREKNSNQ